jgi:fatty acid desaturase
MHGISPETAARIREIRRSLPPEAFQPNPRRLWMMGAHALVVAAGYWCIRVSPITAPLAALLIGHSLACMAFAAHELSHNAVIRQRHLKYLVSLLAFGINAVPPTMWNRLHNDAHHGHAGTSRDPDRPFLEEELSPATAWYARVFYPSTDSWRTVLVLCHFVTYLTRNIACVFYPGDHKPAVVTSKPAYRSHERWYVAGELVAMALMQWGVWRATGSSWTNYLWASPVALCVASGVLMIYVFTNHFLNPIDHEHDPIRGTTSVVVPPAVDWLHANFSFHTEHHLFPSMNSDYYPLVSEALRKEVPGSYSRVPIGRAWRQLWKEPAFRKLTN